jgi:hypothetical protein
MKIGIVGSREFPQLNLVEQFIRDLPLNTTIVSGGAKGVDAMAKEMASRYGLNYIEFLPDTSQCRARHDYTQAYYQRNQEIVNHSDLIVAFTEKETGGTWDTIKRARKSQKPIKIIKPFLLFPGQELQEEKDDSIEISNEKGKGPFHLKRIGLCSFALSLKRYINPITLADLVNWKDTDPQAFAEYATPKFIEFFEKNNPGCIHAITQPPKSKRHLDRLHPMDIVCQNVAKHIGIEFVQLFEPWEKTGRGRGVKHPLKIVTAVGIEKFIGRVVYVLDDVITTGETMRISCKSLNTMQIHAHGLGFILWS